MVDGAGQVAQWLGTRDSESHLPTEMQSVMKNRSMNYQVHLDDAVRQLGREMKPATECLLELKQKHQV